MCRIQKYCFLLGNEWEYIIESILSGLNLRDTILYKISLICSKQSLIERILRDTDNGIRTTDV